MRIVASFTTVPSRLDKILPMVSSVAYQTRKPDRFVLWLPPRCDKEGVEYCFAEGMREQLLEFGVEIGSCERDFGPATKLIPALKSEVDGETLIVTLDDDVLYERHTFEIFERESGKYPDSALGFVGFVQKQYIHGEELPRLNIPMMRVDGLGGYRGVAYRRRLFDNSIFEDIDAMLVGGPFIVDDHLISWNLVRRGIPRTVIEAAPGIKPGVISSGMLDLGEGIYMGAGKRGKDLACESLARLTEMYDRNKWRRT